MRLCSRCEWEEGEYQTRWRRTHLSRSGSACWELWSPWCRAHSQQPHGTGTTCSLGCLAAEHARPWSGGENVTLRLVVLVTCHLLCNTSQPGCRHTDITGSVQPPHLTPAITLHCKAFTAVNKIIDPSNFTVHCRSLLEKVAFRKLVKC